LLIRRPEGEENSPLSHECVRELPAGR
jgi:hypothetical protein